MSHLSPADLWGLELIKKWKSLGNNNTLDYIKTLCSGFHEALWTEMLLKTNNPLYLVKENLFIWQQMRWQNDLSFVLQLLYDQTLEYTY